MASYNKFAKEYARKESITFAQALTSPECKRDYKEFLDGVEEIKQKILSQPSIYEKPIEEPEPSVNKNYQIQKKSKKPTKKKIVYISESESEEESEEEVVEYVKRKKRPSANSGGKPRNSGYNSRRSK